MDLTKAAKLYYVIVPVSRIKFIAFYSTIIKILLLFRYHFIACLGSLKQAQWLGDQLMVAVGQPSIGHPTTGLLNCRCRF